MGTCRRWHREVRRAVITRGGSFITVQGGWPEVNLTGPARGRYRSRLELDPRRRKRAFICFVVACVCWAALALMNAVEPWVFADRHWDVGRGITVTGAILLPAAPSSLNRPRTCAQ